MTYHEHEGDASLYEGHEGDAMRRRLTGDLSDDDSMD